MRAVLLLPLLLLGCTETALIEGSTGGFGADFDVGDDCAPVRDQDVVSFDATEREHVLVFDNPCGEPGLQAALDDPDDAFASSEPDYRPDARVEIRVELVATEPGTYEAQLSVGLPDAGQTVVELFASIDEEEG